MTRFRYLAPIFVSLCLTAAAAGAADLYSGPESVVYDSITDKYYVSSYYGSRIIQVDRNGLQSNWLTNLDGPLGMCLDGRTLYVSVASGILGLDLDGGGQVFALPITDPIGHMDGLDTDTAGNLYGVDTGGRLLKINVATQEITVLAAAGIYSSPQACVYDPILNRVIIACYSNGSPLVAVDAESGALSYWATSGPGRYDGIARDSLGRFLVASHNGGGAIYRYDQNLTEPGEIISTGHDEPAGLTYNEVDDILAVPNFADNSVSYVPMKIRFSADTTWGAPPLTVALAGWAEEGIEEWLWEFGDSQTASGQTPSVVFSTPGSFDVTIKGVTAQNDTLTRTLPNYIGVLGDSLWADTLSLEYSGTVEVVIYSRNNVAVSELRIPVVYTGSLDLTWDSLSIESCRTEPFDYVAQVVSAPANKVATFRLANIGQQYFMEPGTGPVLRLFFHTGDWLSTGASASIDLSGFNSSNQPTMYGETGVGTVLAGEQITYHPHTSAGLITYVSCCTGFRGNINDDPDEVIDISDLVDLVSYMFSEGTRPACMIEANIDGDIFGQITIADLVQLVGYMFQQGPPPANCP